MPHAKTPEWANYLAMNMNGDWYYYECQPKLIQGLWSPPHGGRIEFSHSEEQKYINSLRDLNAEEFPL